MNQEHASVNGVSFAAKIGFGILLPVATFVAYQLALIGSTSGTGSWDGMTIFFGSIVIVPGLLVLNCWVIPVRWVQKRLVFLAGAMLPAVIGFVEYFWLHGPYKIRGAINAAFVAPGTWIWFFIIMLFAPLIVSLAYALTRRRKHQFLSKKNS
jgi:hypothetical protein